MDDSPKPDRFLEAEEAAAQLLSALDALQTEIDTYRTASTKLVAASSHIEATLNSVQRISNVSEQAVATTQQMALDLRADIEPIATSGRETAERLTALERHAIRSFRSIVTGLSLVGLLGLVDIALRIFSR